MRSVFWLVTEIGVTDSLRVSGYPKEHPFTRKAAHALLSSCCAASTGPHASHPRSTRGFTLGWANCEWLIASGAESKPWKARPMAGGSSARSCFPFLDIRQDRRRAPCTAPLVVSYEVKLFRKNRSNQPSNSVRDRPPRCEERALKTSLQEVEHRAH